MADVPRLSASPTEHSSTERDFVSLLIKLYRECPELWKVKSVDYMNKVKRRLAMKKILNVLNIYRPDYNEEKLKKKINILRTNFNKEWQKIDQKKKSGASDDEIPEPSLWYYNEFFFIKDQMEVADTETFEKSVVNVKKSLLQHPRKEKSASQDDTPMKKKKISHSTQALTDLAIAYFKTPYNEIDIIAKGWVMKLNRVAPDQRRFAEKIINDTIFEAEMGTLTRNGVSFLTASTPAVSPAHSISPAHSSPASCTSKDPSYLL